MWLATGWRPRKRFEDPTRAHSPPRESVLAVAATLMELHSACLRAIAAEACGVEEVLTLPEAAKRLKISPTTLYRKARHELRGLVVDLDTTSLRFSASRIDAYIRGSLNDLGPTNEFSSIVRRRKPRRDSHG